VFDRSGQVITARDFPQLLGVKTTITAEGLQIIAGADSFTVPFTPSNDTLQDIRVFSEETAGVEVNSALSDWFCEYLQTHCRLLYMNSASHRPVATKRGGQFGDVVSYADECPILLISEASLADLNGRLETPVTMAHFRPNIVVSGCAPFAEDQWSAVQIGETTYDVVQTCKRCVFTTIDPITQQKSPTQEPLRTLTTYRQWDKGIHFGVHLIPRQTGTIHTDQTITVTNK